MRIGHAADLVIGLAFAGLGSAIFIVASGFRTLPGMAVGSGLFPKITGTGMVIFGIVMALQAMRPARRLEEARPQGLEPPGDGPADQAMPPTGAQARYAMALVGALAALILAMPHTGFLAASLVFTGFLVILGGGRWSGAALFSVLATATVYLVFTHGLRVPLPRGPF